MLYGTSNGGSGVVRNVPDPAQNFRQQSDALFPNISFYHVTAERKVYSRRTDHLRVFKSEQGVGRKKVEAHKCAVIRRKSETNPPFRLRSA